MATDKGIALVEPPASLEVAEPPPRAPPRAPGASFTVHFAEGANEGPLVQEGASFRSRTASEGVRLLTESFNREAVADPEAPKDGSRCTSNIKTLSLTSFLFISITCAQAVAAKISHSQALLVDCISMGVDGLTFLCNIFVELRKQDGLEHLRAQLVVTAISLGCLTFFTIDALRESWSTATTCWDKDHKDSGDSGEEEVNPYIVMAFALAGLLFDVASLIAFYRSHKKTGGGKQLNMCTALLHVGADCLRSTTTLVLSILILNGFDGTCTDAYASLVVGATILFGAAGGIFSWFKKFCRFIGSGTAPDPSIES